jgi:hypothetical protein
LVKCPSAFEVRRHRQEDVGSLRGFGQVHVRDDEEFEIVDKTIVFLGRRGILAEYHRGADFVLADLPRDVASAATTSVMSVFQKRPPHPGCARCECSLRRAEAGGRNPQRSCR